MIVCNLCNWNAEVTDDTLLRIRMKRHEEFHATARIQHRNTANGKVEWMIR